MYQRFHDHISQYLQPQCCYLSVTVVIFAILLSFFNSPPALAECRGIDGGSGVVSEISAGETLILNDGRSIRLSGVLTPKRVRFGPASKARKEMEKFLAIQLLGKKVRLQHDERKRDRYGRILAHVFVISGQDKAVWFQKRLVKAGLARVISYPDNRICITELLNIEKIARNKLKGLWGTGFFALRSAKADDLLHSLARNYEIVEGRVANIAHVKGRVYINFGENWREDFTAFIPPKYAKNFNANENKKGGIFFNDLLGARVRIRGWLKNYNGPSITITHPEQIEIIEKVNSIMSFQ